MVNRSMIELISRTPTKRTKKTPLLLQHGAWHGAWCWQNWLDYFAKLGYEVHALSQPGHGRTPLGKAHINLYTLNDYADVLAQVASQISPRPVIIGHSMGGAITQKFLETYYAPAAVLLGSMPQRGILPFLLKLLRHHTADMLKVQATLNNIHLVNSAAKVRQHFFTPHTAGIDFEAWASQLVPESMAVTLQAALPLADPDKVRHTPLLVVAGGQDAIFSVAEEQQTAAVYGAEFKLFPDQGHNLMADSGWREVADAIDAWLGRVLA